MRLPERSEYRPKRPLLVWDGQCGFCNYWVTRWKRLTGDTVRYSPYHKILSEIKDIPEEAFKEAVRLIAPDGKIFSGAGAAFRTLSYSTQWKRLYHYYQKSSVFKTISDRAYRFVAGHRPLLFKLTKIMFGKDPVKMKHYWLLYLLAIVLLILFWD